MDAQRKLNREISTLVAPALSTKSRAKAKLTYGEFLSDKMLMISAIRAGIPYSLFDLIRDVTPFSETEWSEFLNISTKSLSRYKQSSRPFKPIQSEKIIELAEVANIGKDVFGSIEKFKLWLDTPNLALGKMKPIELLKDSYGKEMVIGELTRIEHGIFV